MPFIAGVVTKATSQLANSPDTYEQNPYLKVIRAWKNKLDSKGKYFGVFHETDGILQI